MYLIGFREAASNNALYCDQSMTVKFNAQGDIVDFRKQTDYVFAG